jgi:hypothetical protein
MEEKGFTGKGPEHVNDDHQSSGLSRPFSKTLSYDFHEKKGRGTGGI